MTKKHYPVGLDSRMRDRDGEIHKKRSDTLVGTLRKIYGEAKLGTVLKQEGVKTLDQLIELLRTSEF